MKSHDNMRYNGAIIISAFPGCGKSYMCKHHMYDPFRLSDSDSSKYSWIYDKNGNRTGERNPNFVEDYLNHIISETRYKDFVFISSHKQIRDALIERKIPFILVYPDITMKEVMIHRMIMRGNGENFVNFQRAHYEEFINEIEEELIPKLETESVALYQLDENQPFIDKEMLEYLNNLY